MIRKEPVANKQQIVSDYLTGDQTFDALSLKYGVNARTIQTWTRAFRLRQLPGVASSVNYGQDDVKMLKKQLREAELKNELLEEMLRLSQEHTGIDLRKKFGARQS
jgi:transposase-like protein